MIERLLAGARARFAGWALLLLLGLLAGGASAQGTSSFDHLRTGFALVDAHAKARCEACHQDGVLKGTPRECKSCHVSGQRFARGNVVMSNNHLPTTQACDSCHTAKTFTGARFNHAGVSNGSCLSCHNGTSAPGKSANHLATSKSCDSCHRSTAWLPVESIDHAGLGIGTCGTCHNGTKATGKPATHMPAGTGNACDDCHRSYSAWRPTAWNHSQLPVNGQCASCHSGGFPPADGKPANHVPLQNVAGASTANCDACHKGGFSTWANGKFHANFTVSTGCASCHTGGLLAAVGKPATAIHNNASRCESCHKSASTWSGAKVDHSSFNASTTCASCHDGSTTTGKSATHIPVGSTNCASCHATTGWKPTQWTHTQLAVAGQCASCHTGGYPPADGRSAKHIPYASVPASATATCDACHKSGYAAWTPAKFHANVTVGTGCASCHTGAFQAAVGKPATPVHNGVTGNCESCHKSVSSWAGAKVDHSGFNAGTNCAQCHTGTGVSGKSATHIPTGSAGCFSCHSVTAWTPSKWNHTQVAVAGQCASCHTGGYPPADGRSANHIPFASVAATASANCDACHKGGFGTWTGAKFHASVTIGGSCATCHTGGFPPAVGKPANTLHSTVTGNCESCHKSTTTWASAKVDHSGFNDGTNCAQCHNGNSATGRSATHLPSGSANCFSCHGTSSWTPSKWNHTQLPVTGQCASCHSGGYPPADGRPPNHVPYATVAVMASANCDACHKGNFSAWSNGKVHANFAVTSACANCHTGGYLAATGKPGNALHATVVGNCESCHKSASAWSGAKVDHSGFNESTACAGCHNGSAATGKPGTHIPSGSANCFTCHATNGWTPSKWNHTQLAVVGQCASCHTGGYPPADGRSARHVPYASVPETASAGCDTCHRSGFAAWTPARLHANVTVSSGCAACHTGAFPPAVGKPATSIHATVTGNCESCHKSTSSWSGAKVDHSGFNDATNCAQCHNGNGASGKSASHMPVGSTNCFSCHSTTGWTPSKWNHKQLSVTGQCANCHTGGYPPADGRSPNHVPYASVAATASANCDTCHKAGFAAWAPAKVHANVTIATGCASCHSGAFPPAVGKPSTAIHATVTGNCESCHKSTATWSGAKVDHSGFNASTNCAQCHNGGSATGKSASHVPVGATNCFSCHSTTGWTPTKWNHTQLAVTAQCASCHTGGYPPADGKVSNHIPYQTVSVSSAANCDGCHKGSTTTWANGRFHANYSVSTGCFSCHTGGYLAAVGKPSTSIHATVTGNCESCHKSTSTWSGAKVDHSGFNDATNCAQCHNGGSATGKSASHVPVGATNCFSCHSTTGWTPTKWNHTQLAVTAQCASCHTGGYPPADGKVSNHIPYQTVSVSSAANCDGCHKGSTTTWANGRFHANYSVSTGCFSCHTGGYLAAVGKPSTSIHATVTGNCESCHKSTSTWSGAKVDHSGFNDATNCAQCHNGGSATGKSASHVPVGATNCFSCHSTTGWTPTKWNHTQLAVTAQCASCHTGGYPPADGKVSNHIPYQTISVSSAANCDGCHKGSTTTWANGRFHANYSVSTGCFSCHTGGYLAAVGKPSTSIHATVTGNCESCHKSTSTWSGAKVDHSGFNDATNCAQCHNGGSATGKSASHVPVGATNCFSCHSTTGWTPTKWNHTQLAVTAQCASCHTGGYPPADGKVANHIPYQTVAVSAAANCDGCHKGSTTTWANGRFHANYSVSTGCFSCHTGGYLAAVGKPSTSIHATVTGNCESCHKSTATWSGAKVDHSGFNDATNCAQCHNGGSATGKSATHVPVGSTNCFSCHSTTGWTPTKWNHTQLAVTAQCASCHTGGYPPADGKVSNHIPYQTISVSSAANCDGCHKGSTTTWANGRFHANYSVSTGCFSCHTGGYLAAVGKPSTSIHATVTGNCESCHKSTATWSGAKVDHSGFNASTNCAQCHNGGSATGKPGTHIPVGATNCFSCHSTTGWTPTKWNHTQVLVTAQCASCHSGGYPPADGKVSNHIPYQTVAVSAAANCDACHKGSTTTWANGRFHANFSVSTGCFSCHTGSYLNAVGKPSTTIHATVTGNCESCHKTTSSWSAQVDHSTFNASTNCASCHNGSAATGKPGTHIPVGATNCFSCHSTTGWTPTKWNHTQVLVTSQCASCHSGGYPPADGKVSNHIPYQTVAVSAAANCDACHKGSTTTWANGRFHANFSVSTGCFSCHTGSYLNAVGKPSTTIHATVTGNCESCHKTTSSWSAQVDHSTFNASTNCASCHNGSAATGKPGTHIPVGATNCFSCHSTTGWTPTKWNHTQVLVTSQCASCHSGGYPPADGKVSNHIPYQTVAVSAAANCDACHKGSTTTWANGRFHANFSVSTGCFSCHTGSYLNAVGKPSTTIHATVTGNCESCHKTTSSWSAQVDHSTFNASTNCASCHNGSAATGKPGTHIPVGATNCFSCHSTTGWTPTKWNHTQVLVTSQCASCHSGGYPPADGKVSNHIPYQTVAVSAAANCDACHKGSTTTWANGRFHANFSVSTGCFSCHTGSYLAATGKPANSIHAAVTGSCESCHKSTTTWSGARIDHSGFNASTNCAQCHNGSTANGKPGNHIPEVQLLNGSAMYCGACHTSTSSWGSVRMNHNNSLGNGAGWCKGCHLRGTSYAGSMERMSLTHEKSTGVTDCSQSGCHRPLGNKGSAYTKWD